MYVPQTVFQSNAVSRLSWVPGLLSLPWVSLKFTGLGQILLWLSCISFLKGGGTGLQPFGLEPQPLHKTSFSLFLSVSPMPCTLWAQCPLGAALDPSLAKVYATKKFPEPLRKILSHGPPGYPATLREWCLEGSEVCLSGLLPPH